jgi:glycosyltransferase involved in cell wall biosynthesis
MNSGRDIDERSEAALMDAHIVFASTYPPVVCGIGNYLSYLVGAMQGGTASLVAFDPERYEGRVASGQAVDPSVPVRFALARPTIDPAELMEAVADMTPLPLDRTVLWFQHAPDIWPQLPALLRAIRDYPVRKVASLHTIHFQSPQTPSGLRSSEWRLLRDLLPWLDQVTVFTPSVRQAVRRAFPEYSDKVTLLYHGVHGPRPIAREDARRRLAQHLGRVPHTVHPRRSVSLLIRALDDPDTIVLGSLGFLQWDKGFEAVYDLRDALQARLPERRVVGLVMGSVRDRADRRNRRLLARLAARADDDGRFLVATLTPDAVFQAGLRALDLNLYWPDSATQSGRVAHALGVGANLIGRDVEGLGEALRDVGAPACTGFDELVSCALDLLRSPARRQSLRIRCLEYAEQYSWKRQARSHLEIAHALVESHPLATLPALTAGAIAESRTGPSLEEQRPPAALL